MQLSRRLAVLVVMVLALCGLRVSAQTDAPPQSRSDVAINLVLAVDTSGSVSAGRFELQKQGYAAAFRNPKLLSLIRSLDTQSIAVIHDAVDRAAAACRRSRLDTDQG